MPGNPGFLCSAIMGITGLSEVGDIIEQADPEPMDISVDEHELEEAMILSYSSNQSTQVSNQRFK